MRLKKKVGKSPNFLVYFQIPLDVVATTRYDVLTK
nr:MAG TPA: hypothetical protein [Caudoviricetes sp.]